MLHYQVPYSFTINDVIEKNQQFLCEFVNLKRDGFLHYTKALDNYTCFFWSPWLRDADTHIKNTAENMKLLIRGK